MKEIRYKGRGEHNVYQLEAIIEQREEKIHHLCLEDAGLLAEIRNKMGPVAHLVSLVKIIQDDEYEDSQIDYVKIQMPEAIERATQAIEWLRDNNNF
jgi:hypothetical protein